MAIVKKKVLIAAPIHQVLEIGLKELGYELFFALDIDQTQAKDLVKDVVGIITSTRLQLDKELIDMAYQLTWVGRMGSGMEVIDVDYATEKGIKCFSSPEGNANAVAEHALGMLLSLTKRIVISNNEIKEGQWLREENRGVELEGKTIGIIGYGYTGKAFANKLKGFDTEILAYDKYKQDKATDKLSFCNDLDPIYEKADIISFHVPLRQDTIDYFNDDFLNNMKKSVILINTSRGNVVNTNTLLKGLKSKKIAGACLDVFEEEPINKMSISIKESFMYISSLTNVIVTPHIAGYSHEALYKMSKILLHNIVTYV